ncbi:unnamed protein product [Prunus armeniaca]
MASKKIQTILVAKGKNVSASFSSGDSTGVVTRSKAKAISATPQVTSILTQAKVKDVNRLSIWPPWGQRRISPGWMRETLGTKKGVFWARRIQENVPSRLFQTLTRAQTHTMDPRLTTNRRRLHRRP